MHNRDIAFDWRATMGLSSNAQSEAADVVAYLDLISELCQDDGSYLYRTANRHTCACDDPIVIDSAALPVYLEGDTTTAQNRTALTATCGEVDTGGTALSPFMLRL